MKPRAISILCVVLALTAASMVTTAEDRKANALLQSGNTKVTLQGDYKGAIEDYKKALKEAGTNDALTARILIRLGDAYQRHGEQDARTVFERIVREFSNQKEIAAEAQSRLALLAPARPPISNSITRREFTHVEADGDPCRLVDSFSADGRYVLCSDRSDRADVRDLETGVVFSHIHQDYARGILSRDGKKLVYTVEKGIGALELWFVSLSGANPQARKLFESPDVDYMTAHDLTPDGDQVVVSLNLKDRTTQIGLVSVPEGSLQVLRSVDWRGPSRMFIAPDGKQLAYDLPANETSGQRDVFVLALDGSREVRVVNEPTNDVVMGWSPDGKQLVFASESSTDVINLHALTIVGGKADGVSRLLTRNIGSMESRGVTNSGALYLVVRGPSQSRIRIAGFDFNTERFTVPAGLPRELKGAGPRWSPDGRYLLYQQGQQSLTVRSVENGQVIREVIPALDSFTVLGWSSDSESFVVRGRDFKGRSAIYRIDQAGNASPLLGDDCKCLQTSLPILSPDGARLYYQPDRARPFVVRDLSSGRENELPIPGNPTVSPDGRHLAVIRPGSMIHLLPAEGGSARELFPGLRLFWAPDGRSILVPNANGIWRVSLDGQAHKLDFSSFLSSAETAAGIPVGGLQISLNGLIALQYSGETIPSSIRMIENFLSVSDSPAPRTGVAEVNTENSQMTWLDRAGKVIERFGPQGRYRDIALSPDGKRIAISRQESNGYDIWILESGRTTLSRLTNGAGSGQQNRYPVWSPDGKKVAFVFTQNGKSRLYLKDTNGNSAAATLVDSQIPMRDLSWSVDGRFLVYVTLDPKTGDDIWAIPMTGDRKAFPVVQTLRDEFLAQVSPDGKWLAYAVRTLQRNVLEVPTGTFVRPFPGGPLSGERRVSFPIGYPRWRSDSKELFFVANPGNGIDSLGLYRVGIEEPFELSGRQSLIPGSVFGDLRPYAISPDGQRILVLLPVR